MDKLNFLTAGLPSNCNGYNEGFQKLKEIDLDGLEAEFVHGVRMNNETQKLVAQKTASKEFIVTAHGPYYINLNSKEPDKIEASIVRILETAKMGKLIGAYSITFHAGFYMGKDENSTFNIIFNGIKRINEELRKENNTIWIRPETTGKSTQWGNLKEIVKLSKEFEYVLPCVDFAHLHARYNGNYNTYDEFCKILEYIGNELGEKALTNFHGHVAGIAYSLKGEKNHLIFEESDFNYKDLLKALKSFNTKGVIVCESPNIEIDTKILKDYYLTI